ncbi:Malate dehydrogenase [Operophtera brumata]|uniref:Malate dehydrogenase n=1 Tax=Operophtera brumata TaxID=104452 RepID=A0A0L7LFD1_OPEBR|nr:Malate dehydrogenase [Operophtera brumata]
MNFQLSPVLPPLKVLVVNPLSPAGRLVIIKIMSGTVFGSNQLIDLILLVYSNEKPSAKEYKVELKSSAFSCMNSVEISSDLPSFSDADVFCFITNFSNPNRMDFENIDTDTFDELYLIIKIANSLIKPVPKPEPVENPVVFKKKGVKVFPKLRKPIIFSDGLVAMDILMTLSQNVLLSSCKNPYGCIYKASNFAKSLQTIWSARSSGDGIKVYCNLGVISDGSLGTIKGYPCVLPLVFVEDNWTVNKRFEETPHLQLEIKRINKAVKDHHLKMIPYCKKFIEDNIINQAFIPDDESGSTYALSEKSSLTTV